MFILNKQNKYNEKFLSFLFTVISSLSFATPFEANGVYYEKTSSTTLSVAAASYVSGWYTYYKGNVVVPETVVYNGNEYIVTEIGNQAFRGQSKLTSISFHQVLRKLMTRHSLDVFHWQMSVFLKILH